MQNINKLIKRNSAFTNLSQTITEQQHLLEYIRALLPKSIAPHCLAAVRNRSTLTLFVDSPAWSSRLRYLTAELLRSLNNNDPKIDRIKIRIMPHAVDSKTNRPKRHIKALPKEEAKQLQNVAESIEDDELSAALRRLAQHVKGD